MAALGQFSSGCLLKIPDFHRGYDSGDEALSEECMSVSSEHISAPGTTGSVSSFIRRIVDTTDSEEAFAVFNLTALQQRAKTWFNCMPRVQPFYAVKCNPDPRILHVLADMGSNFDCASKGEIDLVKALGVDLDERVIYANPCKLPTHLRYARAVGVKMTTFDTESELHKVKQYYPEAALVLRIRADDPNARCQLGNKFGAGPQDVLPLLRLAKELGLNVIGISFHVGSGATNPAAFAAAIASARRVWDEALGLGFQMRLLDLGGGFSGLDDVDGLALCPVASAINSALDKHFPPADDLRIIAEPGRYLVEACVTIATNVYGNRRNVISCGSESKVSMDYWVSDGVYGTMNCVLFDHARPQPVPLLVCPRDTISEETFPSVIFGPTCDGLDRLQEEFQLPLLQNGDWLLFPFMGAYTLAACTNFNGYNIVQMKRYYVWSVTDGVTPPEATA